ncbi:hypothetical protein NUBL21974_22040 [Klebsiella quasipneumoniae]|nr:hypothetical protein NUBL21974_22040 [Klebsiella quasipneumoniae]
MKPGPAIWRRRGVRSPGNIAIRYGAKAYFAAKVTVREPNKQGAMPDGQPGATLTPVKTTDVYRTDAAAGGAE